MKSLILGILFAVLVTISVQAQPEAQIKELPRMPRGMTTVKIKQHVIEPANTIEAEADNDIVEREETLTTQTRRNAKMKPRLDVNKFGEAIHAKLKNQVTGYVLEVRQNGTPIYGLVWKDAQTTSDKNKNWSNTVKMHIASVSKFLTAVGMVHVLDKKGISYDAKIIDYLPTYWNKGNNIDDITFRQLLTQTSGFGGSSSKSNYTFMKQRVANGVDGVGEYDYENMNFGLMRILIPIINGDINKNHSFYPSNDINNVAWDAVTINFYQEYMQNNVFTPAGVSNAGFSSIPFAGTDALAYNFPALNKKGWDSGDLSTMAGGAGWRLSIKDLLNVMNHVRRKNTIITAQKAQYMLDNHFGIDQTTNTDAGALYNKNGRWHNGDRTEQSVAFFLPNNMEVVVFVNSPIGTNAASLRGTVKDAFIASLIE